MKHTIVVKAKDSKSIPGDLTRSSPRPAHLKDVVYSLTGSAYYWTRIAGKSKGAWTHETAADS